MNSIISLCINLCITIIISSLTGLLTEGSKYSLYVKSTISIVIISIIINFILNFKLEINTDYEMESYSIESYDAWNNALVNTSEKLEDEMYKLCLNNGFSVDSIEVLLQTDRSDISLVSVDICGKDSRLCKNLIVGYFNINPAYITIDGV